VQARRCWLLDVRRWQQWPVLWQRGLKGDRVNTHYWRSLILLGVLILSWISLMPQQVIAQNAELVASLEVLTSGVEVRRINTAEWVPIRMETLVGQGDSVRTDGTGTALLTFFADGTDLELTPNTELTIREFNGSSDQFSLSVEVMVGITRQQFKRLLNPGSSYTVITPGAVMTVRGTDFDIRVESTGRSSAITTEGEIAVSAQGRQAEVPSGFGVRVDVGSDPSEVVPATTFDELDSALDGCAGQVTTDSDVRLYVRLGPGTNYERIGSIDPSEITLLMGVTEDQSWYRFRFSDGFGWFSAAGMNVVLDSSCKPLRRFENPAPEDTTRYGLIGDQTTTVRVNVATANLRSGPGIAYRRVDTATTGDELTVIGRNADNSWLRVVTASGQIAWISVSLVTITTDLDRIGIVPVDEIQPDLGPVPTPMDSESSASTTSP